MHCVLKNFHIIDEESDFIGSIVIDDGFISRLFPEEEFPEGASGAARVIDGRNFLPSGRLPVLMPAFVDLHAHFRDPCLDGNELAASDATLPSETIESASMSAAAGGFGTVVCMANTRPTIDTIERAARIKSRCDALGLIDLYPVMSLTKGLEGKALSEIISLAPDSPYVPLMLSDDGKDVADDDLFLAAMGEAKRLGLPVSCHCDLGGEENAVARVIALGKKALCHVHIAHVSTRGSLDIIRAAKAAANGEGGFKLTCEAMPHNLCLTREDAARLGEKTWGRVNPPLRSEDDRLALISSLTDGTVDAIATDHAPHTRAGKEGGAPGFSGFETAFAALYTELVLAKLRDLRQLSSLMSARPAKLLGFSGDRKRGRLCPGYRADLVIIDTEESWITEPELFKSRGKNSAFAGRRLYGRILATLNAGRIVYER